MSESTSDLRSATFLRCKRYRFSRASLNGCPVGRARRRIGRGGRYVHVCVHMCSIHTQTYKHTTHAQSCFLFCFVFHFCFSFLFFFVYTQTRTHTHTHKHTHTELCGTTSLLVRAKTRQKSELFPSSTTVVVAPTMHQRCL